jgi:hypothetical protein
MEEQPDPGGLLPLFWPSAPPWPHPTLLINPTADNKWPPILSLPSVPFMTCDTPGWAPPYHPAGCTPTHSAPPRVAPPPPHHREPRALDLRKTNSPMEGRSKGERERSFSPCRRRYLECLRHAPRALPLNNSESLVAPVVHNLICVLAATVLQGMNGLHQGRINFALPLSSHGLYKKIYRLL